MVTTGVLRCRDISVRFGGVWALDTVSFDVPTGSVVGIVGGNGSGKSTLLNAISGLQPVAAGRVELDGLDITRLPAWRVARKGVARAFQAPRLPGSLPLATAIRHMLWRPSELQIARPAMADVWSLFGECGLTDRNSLCGQLPFGDRKMAATLVALLAPARLVLLDEPFAGLDSGRVASAMGAVQRLRGAERAAIVVEHDIRRLTMVTDTIAVLDRGRLVAQGVAGAVEVQTAMTTLNLI